MPRNKVLYKGYFFSYLCFFSTASGRLNLTMERKKIYDRGKFQKANHKQSKRFWVNPTGVLHVCFHGTHSVQRFPLLVHCSSIPLAISAKQGHGLEFIII